MKEIVVYVDDKRKPLCKHETAGGEMMKHQIATLILMNLDKAGKWKKLRIVLEDDE